MPQRVYVENATNPVIMLESRSGDMYTFSPGSSSLVRVRLEMRHVTNGVFLFDSMDQKKQHILLETARTLIETDQTIDPYAIYLYPNMQVAYACDSGSEQVEYHAGSTHQQAVSHLVSRRYAEILRTLLRPHPDLQANILSDADAQEQAYLILREGLEYDDYIYTTCPRCNSTAAGCLDLSYMEFQEQGPLPGQPTLGTPLRHLDMVVTHDRIAASANHAIRCKECNSNNITIQEIAVRHDLIVSPRWPL